MIGDSMNLFYSKLWMKFINMADEFCIDENTNLLLIFRF